jgi:hypothetical protein
MTFNEGNAMIEQLMEDCDAVMAAIENIAVSMT